MSAEITKDCQGEGVEARSLVGGSLVASRPALSVSPLGRALRRLRAEHGLTQREVAEAADISQASISRVEDGRVMSMRGENLSRVAAVFGVSADYLMSGAQGSAMSADVATLRRDISEARLQLAAYGTNTWLELVDMARKFGQHASERFSVQPLASVLICSTDDFAEATAYGQAMGNQLAAEDISPQAPSYQSVVDSWRNQRVRATGAAGGVTNWLPLQEEPSVDAGVELHVVDMPFSLGVLRFLVDGQEAASSLTQGALIFAPIAELAAKSVTAQLRLRGEQAALEDRICMLEESLDAVPSPVFVTDRDGRVLLANQHLTSSPPAVLSGHMIDEWLTATTGQPIYELLGALPQGGTYTAVVKQYGPAPLRFRVRHLEARDGELLYIHTGCGGAEAAAEASNTLARAQAELGHVVHDLVRLSAVLGHDDSDSVPEAGADLTGALRMALSITRTSTKSRRMIELLLEGDEGAADPQVG
jgi:transcriptional regulator with XRE-family HTH domain